MTFRVELTAFAKQDVRGILHWLHERSPSGAEAWYRRWSEVLDRLAQQGDTYGLAPEDEDHDVTIRQIIFRTRRGLPYRALFMVRGNVLFILRVRGPGQDLVAPGDLHVPP